jgi:hypothetical protein
LSTRQLSLLEGCFDLFVLKAPASNSAASTSEARAAILNCHFLSPNRDAPGILYIFYTKHGLSRCGRLSAYEIAYEAAGKSNSGASDIYQQQRVQRAPMESPRPNVAVRNRNKQKHIVLDRWAWDEHRMSVEDT